MRSRRSMYSSVLVWVLLVTAAPLIGRQASSSPEAKPPFATTAPKLQKITVDTQYYFTRADYSPPVPVAVVRRAAAGLDSPEDTVVASVSAMSAGDFEWFRSLWAADSRALMEERDRKLGRGPGFWIEKWREALQGRRAVLTARVQTGEYVLIGYRLRGESESASPPPENNSGLFTSVLKKEKGKWLLTQDLASDPVLMNWPSPETPVKLMGREPPK